MRRKQEHRIYEGSCRACVKDIWHNKDNGVHGISQMLPCFYKYCPCKEFTPSDNLDYLEWCYNRTVRI